MRSQCGRVFNALPCSPGTEEALIGAAARKRVAGGVGFADVATCIAVPHFLTTTTAIHCGGRCCGQGGTRVDSEPVACSQGKGKSLESIAHMCELTFGITITPERVNPGRGAIWHTQ